MNNFFLFAQEQTLTADDIFFSYQKKTEKIQNTFYKFEYRFNGFSGDRREKYGNILISKNTKDTLLGYKCCVNVKYRIEKGKKKVRKKAIYDGKKIYAFEKIGKEKTLSINDINIQENMPPTLYPYWIDLLLPKYTFQTEQYLYNKDKIKISLIGSEKINNIDCWNVEILLKNSSVYKLKNNFFIGKKDYLLYKLVTNTQNIDTRKMQIEQFTFKDVKINQDSLKVNKVFDEIILPKGYKIEYLPLPVKLRMFK